MTAPQERPDGLDREAIERRAKAARAAWFLSGPGEDVPEMAESAADVPALLAALRAAEAEVERLRSTWTAPQDAERRTCEVCGGFGEIWRYLGEGDSETVPCGACAALGGTEAT